MTKYDFNKLLEPQEFESLAKDILEIRENKVFEIFGEGKDDGIDLRCQKESEVIIAQVKRISNFATLKSKLIKNESVKVKKQNPNRYILIVSISLSTKQKDEIKAIFGDYIKNTGDIISGYEINSMLGSEEYKKVEITYYQLWINSSNVMQQLLQEEINNDIYVQSRYELNEIQKASNIYVKNEDFEKVKNKVIKNKVVLICGEAGIGKTTLARNLCAYFMNKNRAIQFAYVKSASELLRVYKEEKSQIFLMDDFWGSRFDSNLKETEESKLKLVIDEINKSKNKILILTSREYILQQGYAEFPELEEFFDKYKFKLNVENYSELFKAKILFRHLEKSQLEARAIYQIAENYQRIIQNINYNPRIIENYIEYVLEREEEIDNYLYDFMTYLENPNKLWKEIFEKQSEGGQIIAILMLFGENGNKKEEIKSFFFNYLDNDLSVRAKKKHFDKYVSQLEDTIIEIHQFPSENRIDSYLMFKNPSFETYVFEYFKEHLDEHAKTIIKSTSNLNDLLYLYGFWDGINNKNDFIYKYEVMKLEDINTEYKNLIMERIVDDYDKLKFQDLEEYGYKEGEKNFLKKLIIVMNFYNQNQNKALKKVIIQKIKKVIEDIKKLTINYDDSFSVPELLQKSIDYNIYSEFDIKQILDCIWNSIKFANQINILNDFKRECPIEFAEYYKKIKREEIVNKIINLTLSNAKYFVKNKNDIALEELMVTIIPGLFNNYKIKYQDWYLDKFYEITGKKLLEEIAKFEDEDNYEIIYPDEETRKFFEEKKKIQKHEENIIKIEKERLIENCYNILSKEAVKAYAEEVIENSKIVEKLLSFYNNYDAEYIRAFFDRERSLKLLINYIKEKNAVSKNSKDFFEGLIEYIIKNYEINQKDINILEQIAYEKFKEGTKTIFESELELKFDFETINKFLDSGLIYCIGKKFFFQTRYIHIYMALNVMIKNNETLENIYFNYLENWNNYFCNHTRNICSIYSDIDIKRFNEEFLIPQLKSFTKKVNDKNWLKISKNIIEFLKMEITFVVEKSEARIQFSSLKNSIELMALEYIGMNVLEGIIDKLKVEKVRDTWSVFLIETGIKKYKLDFAREFNYYGELTVSERLEISKYLYKVYLKAVEIIKEFESGEMEKDYRERLGGEGISQ